MGGKDSNYKVVYRGETLEHIIEGEWVFFQRLRKYGGGYWLGRTYKDCYVFEFRFPVSLRQGLEHLLTLQSDKNTGYGFDDDFTLT
jgi:hypothetical protein